MAGQGNEAFRNLGAAANRLIARNAQAFSRLSGADLSVEQRAQRVWDLPAKVAVGRQIAQEELRRAGGAHNDAGDAMRHARWSERTARAAGPLFAEVAGLVHEAKNFADSVHAHGIAGPYERQDGPPGRRLPPTPGQTLDEIRMDLHNNAEGRRAARTGQPVDPVRLQTAPSEPQVYTALYRHPPAGVTFSGHR